jgi:hypothetical protein
MTSRKRELGNARLQQLGESFPAIPRSIILKSDLLREQIRYTPLMNQIGGWATPEFMFWSPEHAQNPQKTSQGGLLLCPWKLDLSDGTPVKVLFRPDSPYEVRGEDGRYLLYRDGESVEEVSFEERPQWFLENTSEGIPLASVFQLEASACVIGCVLRHCEYRKIGKSCRFCCLDSTLDLLRSMGITYDVSMKPQHAVEAYEAALRVGRVDVILLTGGKILDERKEAGNYATIYGALSKVRERAKVDTIFRANPSCLGEDGNKLLQDSGVEVICEDLEIWDERLWPIVCPGKDEYVGRGEYLRRLVRAVEIFGVGNVQTNMIQGLPMVCPAGFENEGEALQSELEGYKWCLKNGIYPITTQWLNLQGAEYYGTEGPLTEYYLRLGYERHKLLEEHDAEFPYTMIRGHCEHCGHSWTDDDYYLKLRQAPQSECDAGQ